MKIKVCGMRAPANISDVVNLGVDMIGFVFCPQSKRCVRMLPSMAGIIPDYVSAGQMQGIDDANEVWGKVERVGVFVDDMPQNIVTRVYGYRLDYVQLHGSEEPVMIDNLRRTLDPDIMPGIKIIKAISVGEDDDIRKAREYEGHADYILFDTKGKEKGGNGEHFDWSLLENYDCGLPFFLSGGIGPEDADAIRNIGHPRMFGIDLNSRFELQPALKDVEKLKKFISEIRR